MKSHADELAIFGGTPLFTSPRPIGQLFTPDVDEYLRLLKNSVDSRHLTKDGPIVQQLEKKLALYHGTRHCISVANAGLGIMMLIQLFAAEKSGEVIMPAFTYRGLPHFAQWAGQMPCFCDVDLQTHFLSLESVEKSINKHTTAILGVCNFNDPGDIDGLTYVAQKNSLPVFLDSVYAIGSTYKGINLGGNTDAEVFSLHATKLLNGFEGGYITTNNDQLAEKLKLQKNFAESCLRPGIGNMEHILGINADLNEMHAAMGLLSLNSIDTIIEKNFLRFESYRQGMEKFSGLELLPYTKKERANYQMAVVKVKESWPLTRDQMVQLLRAEGCNISAYYSPPLHLSEHCPPGLSVPKLPNSETLAKTYFQLPVGKFISREDIENICQLFAFIETKGDVIFSRMNHKASHEKEY